MAAVFIVISPHHQMCVEFNAHHVTLNNFACALKVWTLLSEHVSQTLGFGWPPLARARARSWWENCTHAEHSASLGGPGAGVGVSLKKNLSPFPPHCLFLSLILSLSPLLLHPSLIFSPTPHINSQLDRLTDRTGALQL